jgi:hypothetical protein
MAALTRFATPTLRYALGVQTTLRSVQGGGHSPGDASVGWSAIKNYVLP